MIWIITAGAGHHHSAILCGPRNQPWAQIKGTVQAAGEPVGNDLKGSSQRVTGSGQESPCPKKEWLHNVWSPVQQENVMSLVKMMKNLKMATAEH